MKTRLYYIAVMAIMAASQATAQNKGSNIVNLKHYEAKKVGNTVNVEYTLGYEDLVLKPNEQLTVTPFMVASGDTTLLPPVVFRGGTKEKVLQREKALYGTEPDHGIYEKHAFQNSEMRHRKRRISHNTVNQGDVVEYSYSFPYEPGMKDAEFALRQDITECGKLHPYYSAVNKLQIESIDAKLSFIRPEYAVEKRHKEGMTADINFEQGKYEIKRGLANNAAELDRIYSFTEKIMNNKEVEIESIHIKGYASPEGSYALNSKLAQNRVAALRDHLDLKYNLGSTMFIMDTEPEDWDGVHKWVAGSNIEYKTQVLDIIDNTPDPDARDAKIRALDKGKTYNMLLKDVYPGLRRVDYSIEYVVLPFTVEKGKEMINTDPTLMNLHEFYMVADSYPFGSNQYEHAIETALKYYPDDVVANNNMAALYLSKGDTQKAKSYISRFSDEPGVYNNMGVIKLREGDLDAAEEYFRMAAGNGDENAKYNLENIHSLK